MTRRQVTVDGLELLQIYRGENKRNVKEKMEK